MNIVFTDIDGVLQHSFQGTDEGGGFKKAQRIVDDNVNGFSILAVTYYRYLLQKADAEIVISSDRRLMNEMGEDGVRNLFKKNGIEKEIYGFTPVLDERPNSNAEVRGKEIMASVEELKPSKWVALDDLPISKFLTPSNHVHTQTLYGFTDKDLVVEALSYLGLRSHRAR